jgi:uracil-DNA glycosylase
MSETIQLADIQAKLYERLKPSGWGDVLKSFLLSSDMATILEKLHEESTDGRKFTPKLKQVFRFLEECPYDKLKLVMLLQDPYPLLGDGGVTVADGIPMSCSNTRRVQPSLKFVHQAIAETVYPNEPYNYPLDLKCWSNQGVLLLNIALTTTVGRTGVHYLLWRPFIIHLLDVLAWKNPGLIYAYIGKKAQEYMSITPSNTYKLTAVHPAYAAHQHLDKWDSGGLFPKINQILEKDGKTKIKW